MSKQSELPKSFQEMYALLTSVEKAKRYRGVEEIGELDLEEIEQLYKLAFFQFTAQLIGMLHEPLPITRTERVDVLLAAFETEYLLMLSPKEIRWTGDFIEFLSHLDMFLERYEDAEVNDVYEELYAVCQTAIQALPTFLDVDFDIAASLLTKLKRCADVVEHNKAFTDPLTGLEIPNTDEGYDA